MLYLRIHLYICARQEINSHQIDFIAKGRVQAQRPF